MLPTGAGKSIVLAKMASDAVNLWNGRVLILAHVKELLEQNADKVRRLCPGVPVGIYSAGLKKRDTKTPVLVAGIQSIYKRACDIDPFDLIVVDECFPEGTPVSTPRGNIPIENLYVGQPVHTATGVGEIEAISARPATRLIEIEVEDGTVVQCTANHPLFTSDGWVRAEALEVGACVIRREDVLAMRQAVSTESLSACGRDTSSLHVRRRVEAEDVLLSAVCRSRKEKASRTENAEGDLAAARCERGGQELRMLRQRFSPVAEAGCDGQDYGLHEPIGMEKAAFLLNLLLKESRKPDVRRQYKGKGQQSVEIHQSPTARSWRERAIDIKSGDAFAETGCRVDRGVLNRNKQSQRHPASEPYQNRFGKSQIETGAVPNYGQLC